MATFVSMFVVKNLYHNLKKSNSILSGCFAYQCSKHCSRRALSTFDLSGVFPPIVTSFQSDESVCYSDLERNFEVWNSLPFSGMLQNIICTFVFLIFN